MAATFRMNLVALVREHLVEAHLNILRSLRTTLVTLVEALMSPKVGAPCKASCSRPSSAPQSLHNGYHRRPWEPKAQHHRVCESKAPPGQRAPTGPKSAVIALTVATTNCSPPACVSRSPTCRIERHSRVRGITTPATAQISARARSLDVEIRALCNRARSPSSGLWSPISPAHRNLPASSEPLRIALREVEALAAPPPLSGVLAPSGTDRAMPRAATTASSQEGRLTRSRRDTSHGHTAADAIRNVLAESPRPWNAAEIISAIERTGALAGLRDPATAIRVALRRMVERGEVLRVGRGSYQAASTTPRPVPTEELDLGMSVFGHPPEDTMDDQKEDEL
jgi:hypothetical protein